VKEARKNLAWIRNLSQDHELINLEMIEIQAEAKFGGPLHRRKGCTNSDVPTVVAYRGRDQRREIPEPSETRFVEHVQAAGRSIWSTLLVMGDVPKDSGGLLDAVLPTDDRYRRNRKPSLSSVVRSRH
jgi:hypothetical protein